MYKMIFFVICLLSAGNFSAQEAVPYEEDYYENDSLINVRSTEFVSGDSLLKLKPVTESTIYPKKFKENLLRRYQGSDFEYAREQKKNSFLEKLERLISRILRSIFGEPSSGSSSSGFSWLAIRIFALLLGGFVIYFIIRYLVGKEGNFFFGKRNKKVVISGETIQEDIHEINFNEEIARFELERNFRSAVRYHFLKMLKLLSDKKIISYHPEKTNREYENEIKNNQYRADFSKLTDVFEYVWYGEFPVDENSYGRFKNQFQSFKP